MTEQYDRYFLSYSGAGLPLNLVGEIEAAEIANRNTYFGAKVDEQGRVIQVHKRVYGEVELAHSYEFSADGALCGAEIIDADGEGSKLELAADGQILSRETFEVD